MNPTGKEDKEDRYIMFKIDNEEYAVEVYKIKEVINYAEVTEIPNLSPYVKGVISLRGTVIPILDIKKCFGFPDSQPTKKARIIVINFKEHIAGLPVDSVEEVKNISGGTIIPVPQFMEREKTEFLQGIIEYNSRYIMVLKTSVLLECLRYGN